MLSTRSSICIGKFVNLHRGIYMYLFILFCTALPCCEMYVWLFQAESRNWSHCGWTDDVRSSTENGSVRWYLDVCQLEAHVSNNRVECSCSKPGYIAIFRSQMVIQKTKFDSL